MLIFSYTGAQRHKLPTGHPSQQTIGAHSPSVLQAQETIGAPDRASNPVQIEPDVRKYFTGSCC